MPLATAERHKKIAGTSEVNRGSSKHAEPKRNRSDQAMDGRAAHDRRLAIPF
jgi:hypothetical protein